MKKHLLILLFWPFINSCDKIEDPIPPSNTELDGKWELQTAACFCFFEDGFDFSAHKLDFNSSEKIVAIENSSETFFVSTTGNYNFTIEKDTISIDSKLQYTYKILDDKLTLIFVDIPKIADDEVTLEYLKI